jgi:hypothetical protein
MATDNYDTRVRQSVYKCATARTPSMKQWKLLWLAFVTTYFFKPYQVKQWVIAVQENKNYEQSSLDDTGAWDDNCYVLEKY